MCDMDDQNSKYLFASKMLKNLAQNAQASFPFMQTQYPRRSGLIGQSYKLTCLPYI